MRKFIINYLNEKIHLVILYVFLLCYTCPLYSQTIGEDEYYAKALKGDPEAMHVIGSLYQDENKLDSAIFWFTKSAQKGNMYAQSALGQLLEDQEYPNYKQSFYWYEKAAKQGYNWAQYRIGYFYHNGLGVESNDKKAEMWLKKSAEQGACYGLPQYEYGKYYAIGNTAKEWLLKSYEAGCSEALTEIGVKYMTGYFDENPDSAYHYYELAAFRGNANGFWQLSNCYAKGLGCNQSYKDALELFREAEKRNSSELEIYKVLNNNVMSNSALEYDSIDNCLAFKKDASFYWYRDIAFNDNAECKYRLAISYLNGSYGVKENPEEASFWLRQAAESDMIEAQIIMAQLFEKEGDTSNASYWYKRGLESKKYMITETSDEEYLELKELCKSSIERLR